MTEQNQLFHKIQADHILSIRSFGRKTQCRCESLPSRAKNVVHVKKGKCYSKLYSQKKLTLVKWHLISTNRMKAFKMLSYFCSFVYIECVIIE